MVDQLALAYSDQPVVFLEHDVDYTLGNRQYRWWAGHGSSGTVYLPLVMVASGFLVTNGSEAFYSAYESMVEQAMDRQPGVRIQVDRSRAGNAFSFDIELTNLSEVTLSSSGNGATVNVLVFEEGVEGGATGRFVRGVGEAPIVDLEPGQTASFAVQVTPNDPDWPNLHSVVLVDYRPRGTIGHYETLQAAYQP